MTKSFEIRVCENPDCRLRYPLTQGHSFGERCPKCLGPTVASIERSMQTELPSIPVPRPFLMGALLDNIRSAWNVGAIFRTADCLGIEKLYLCGITPTPESTSLQKTALGANETVEWDYSRNSLDLAKKLCSHGAQLWALEQDDRAISVNSHIVIPDKPIVLIVGNEVTGVDPELLKLSEQILHIPMFGKKRSLNVEVAFGIAVSILNDKFNNNRQNN